MVESPIGATAFQPKHTVVLGFPPLLSLNRTV